MKNYTVLSLLVLMLFSANAQENINNLLAAGVADAKRFTTDYIAPASDGLAYGMNNAWFNNAKSPHRFAFELSIIGNVSFIQDKNKSFTLNIADYQNIRFQDDSPSKVVATALGVNNPDINVIVRFEDPLFGNQETELTLPTGLASTDINILPTAFLQASFSPFKGTQIKARYVPEVDIEEASVGLYGVGIQQEFTSWLSGNKLLPIAISGLVAYTQLNGSYDFIENSVVDGENQQLDTEVRTVLFQLIAGTKLKIINFYGGIGYITGKAETDLLGTFRVNNGVIFSEEIVNPFSISRDISGVRGTVGANLKLGFFGLNIDYTLAEFNSASFGLNFSF